MQRLGQHFLKNTEAIKKIVGALDLKKGDTVIEIGPGQGELTLPLAEACGKVGCNIVAIERDTDLAKDLGLRIKDKGLKKNIEIIYGDALVVLKNPPSSILDTQSSFKLAGNIPYYITGHLLRTISELEKKPALSVFTIQKEVAERIISTPPKMNRLAASVQFWAEPKILARLPKTDFYPPPEVDSAIIKLEMRKEDAGPINAENYYKAVRTLFAQPRKTILNNLLGAKKMKRGMLIEYLAEIGVPPENRPQNLSVELIGKLARCV